MLVLVGRITVVHIGLQDVVVVKQFCVAILFVNCRIKRYSLYISLALPPSLSPAPSLSLSLLLLLSLLHLLCLTLSLPLSFPFFSLHSRFDQCTRNFLCTLVIEFTNSTKSSLKIHVTRRTRGRIVRDRWKLVHFASSKTFSSGRTTHKPRRTVEPAHG